MLFTHKNVLGIRMEVIGDNVCITSLRLNGKVVYCRGEPHKYWLERQFVDENNNPVTGLDVQMEYHPLASAQEVAIAHRRGYGYNPTLPPHPRRSGRQPGNGPL